MPEHWTSEHWRFGPFHLSLESSVDDWVAQVCLKSHITHGQGAVHREMLPFTQYTAAQAFVYLNNYAEYQWELWEAEFEIP
jgi:hypothetical protein